MNELKMSSQIMKYPFLIGVTGHRDIASCDMPALRTFIDEQFKAIKSACEGTSVAVMTCLAEGADQLCAEIALANKLAVDYREKNKSSNKMIVGTSIATVLFFMLYDVFDVTPALFVTLLCLAITAVMKYIAKKSDYLGKQVEYRLLAETNRVQEFTTGLGKPYSVCDFYSYFIKDSYGWIEQAARAHLVSNDGDKFLDENAVRDNWCHGQ